MDVAPNSYFLEDVLLNSINTPYISKLLNTATIKFPYKKKLYVDGDVYRRNMAYINKKDQARLKIFKWYYGYHNGNLQIGLDKKRVSILDSKFTSNFINTIKNDPVKNRRYIMFIGARSIIDPLSIFSKEDLKKLLDLNDQGYNVEVYEFRDLGLELDFTNLSNYTDETHYIYHYNDLMTDYIEEKIGLYTKENYEERLRKLKEIYVNYNVYENYKDEIREILIEDAKLSGDKLEAKLKELKDYAINSIKTARKKLEEES